MIILLITAVLTVPTLQSQLKILNTPGGTGPAPCALTCAGVANWNVQGSWGWKDSTEFPGMVWRMIPISGCGFVSPPVITATATSVGPKGGLCPALTKRGFVSGSQFAVYAVSKATEKQMRSDQCSIHWIATGFNC